MQNLVDHITFHHFIDSMNKSLLDWFKAIPNGKEFSDFKRIHTGPSRIPLTSLDFLLLCIPDLNPAPPIARHRRVLAIMAHFIKIFSVMKGNKNNFDNNFDVNIKETRSVGEYNFEIINKPYIKQYKKFMDTHWDELVDWDAKFKEMINKE